MLKQLQGFYFLNKKNIFTLINPNSSKPLLRMKNLHFKTLLIVIVILFSAKNSFSQTAFTQTSFTNDFKKASYKTLDIFNKKEDNCVKVILKP